MRFAAVLLSGMLMATPTFAQQASSTTTSLPINLQRPSLDINWSIEETRSASIPAEIVADTRALARNGLPDGRVDTTEERGDIEEAWYSEPTRRYRHGVLGDAIEAAALKVRTFRGETYTFRLPSTEVFEDITPRIADLDGDGTNEVISILSSRQDGASVAVFGLVGNAFVKKAQSKFIGRSNRWLNIAGIDHFASRRAKQIAIVETPHLAGVFKLLFISTTSSQLLSNTRVPGFSNHQIGSRELRLSAVGNLDNDGLADLVLPSLDRRLLYIISPTRRGVKLLSRIELPARVNRAIALKGEGDSLELTVGLDDGKRYVVKQQ